MEASEVNLKNNSCVARKMIVSDIITQKKEEKF